MATVIIDESNQGLSLEKILGKSVIEDLRLINEKRAEIEDALPEGKRAPFVSFYNSIQRYEFNEQRETMESLGRDFSKYDFAALSLVVKAGLNNKTLIKYLKNISMN